MKRGNPIAGKADREGGESAAFKKSEKVAFTPPSEKKKNKRGK